MKIERILASIREPAKPAEKPTEKTASPNPPDPSAPPREALLAALHTALGDGEKTASTPASAGPIDDLMKTAGEILAADKEAAAKEAQVLGAAFGDACVARLDVWLKHAQDMLATAPPPTGTTSEQLKEAAQAGYQQAREELEKAAADYDRGWNETVDAIFKTAADEFLKGVHVAAQLCDAARAA